MAKPRKNYSKNRISLNWVAFYIAVAGIIFLLLYYSGVINFNFFNTTNLPEREVEYYQ